MKQSSGIYTVEEVVVIAEQSGFRTCGRRWIVNTTVSARINSRNARGEGNRAKKRIARIYSS